MDLSLPTNVVAEADRDVIGGGYIVDSDVYKGHVELMYLDKSVNGAISVNIHFNTGKQVLKNTVYISNRSGGFTYEDKRDGSTKPLPGYSQMNAMFLAINGKPLGEQDKEEKVINIYDYSVGKELPVSRTVFVETLNAPLAIGVLKISEEKATKDSGYKQGTGEFRELNEFDKFFNADSGLTLTEQAAGETEPAFLAKWKKSKKGIVKVKNAKIPGIAGGAVAGAPGASSPAAVAAVADDLFKDA
jgi:hypothetical protein